MAPAPGPAIELIRPRPGEGTYQTARKGCLE